MNLIYLDLNHMTSRNFHNILLSEEIIIGRDKNKTSCQSGLPREGKKKGNNREIWNVKEENKSNFIRYVHK